MDLGFRFSKLASGDVAITRGDKTVTTLRGVAATAFLAKAEPASFEEQQGLMARATGNYRRGNEAVARRHPRNR